MEIRKYVLEDEYALMQMIRNEGEEWRCYWADENQTKYRHALRYSITYIAVENGEVCGYIRSLDDMGFYIYVCDLLVTAKYRGRDIGRKLMEQLTTDYPNQTVFVMSDVDEYYQKLGYPIIGSILEVRPKQDNK
jgi:ribosomal protein S18 acetylase RimI-like enzyme